MHPIHIGIYVVGLSAERLVDVMKRINMAGRRLKARACTAAVGGVLGSTSTRLDRLEFSTRLTAGEAAA